MLCYVGKATKIFLFLVAVLAAVGLFLGVGLHRHAWAHKPVRPPCPDRGGGGDGLCSPSAAVPPLQLPPRPADPAFAAGTMAPPSPPSTEATAAPSPPAAEAAPSPPAAEAAPSPPVPEATAAPPQFLNPPTEITPQPVPAASSVAAAPPPVLSPPSPAADASPGPGQA